MMTNKNLIYIAGPTGVGKTELSIAVAKKLNTEIISCDSRQFFKELKIGTSPPSRKQLDTIKHHFIHNKSNCKLLWASPRMHYDIINAKKANCDIITMQTNMFKKMSFLKI